MTNQEALEIFIKEIEWRKDELEKWKNITDTNAFGEGLVIKKQEIYQFNGFNVRGEQAYIAIKHHEDKIRAVEMAIEALKKQTQF